MDATTVAVAGLGLASTLAAAWLTARLQTRGLVDTELASARVQAYGDCAQALYELERVSFNRALHKASAAKDEDAERAQVVYAQNSTTRAAIGRLAILTEQKQLIKELDDLRSQIRTLHDRPATLRTEHDEIMRRLAEILGQVRDRFDDFLGR